MSGFSLIALAAVAGTGSRALDFLTLAEPSVFWSVLGSILVGLSSGTLGCFLVLRRMSLMGDVLSHATLPGIAVAFLIAGGSYLLPLYIGALGAGILAALVIGAIANHGRTRPDAALALVLTSFFGFGIALLSHIQNIPSENKGNLKQFLFGNVVSILPEEVGVLAVLTLLSIGAVIVFYRPLQLLSFDPIFTRSIGYRTGLIHYALMGLISLVIVSSLQSVGVVLVVAMLITPAATARLLTDRLPIMIVFSAIIGAFSGYVGALLAYTYDWASGPTMVLVASACFLVAALFSRNGVIMVLLRRRRRAHVHREQLLLELLQRDEDMTEHALLSLCGTHPNLMRRTLKTLQRQGRLALDPGTGFLKIVDG